MSDINHAHFTTHLQPGVSLDLIPASTHEARDGMVTELPWRLRIAKYSPVTFSLSFEDPADIDRLTDELVAKRGDRRNAELRHYLGTIANRLGLSTTDTELTQPAEVERVGEQVLALIEDLQGGAR